MTWLFTQVWLWSLAAFMLGALLSWLLFVPRLKRQVRMLTSENSGYPEYRDELGDPAGYGGSDSEARRDEHGSLDLLVPESEEPEEPEDSQELTFGDWERAPRVWGAERARSASQDESSAATHRFEPVAAPTESMPAEAGSAEPTVEEPVPSAPAEAGSAEPTVEEPAPSAPAEADDSELRLEQERERSDRGAERRPLVSWAASLPTAPAEGEITDTALVEQHPETSFGGSLSSWFQKSEVDEYPDPHEHPDHEHPDHEQPDHEHPDHEQPDPHETPDSATSLGQPEGEPAAPRAKGAAAAEDFSFEQARSLFDPPAFDPPAAPGAGQRDEGSSSAAMDAAAMDAAVTQSIPFVDDSTPLPQRTPGAGPRPGARKANGSQERVADESAAPSGRKGGMVKGHFGSRRYHTPDSPDYDEIEAEVWFRTAADAEQAGFEPWDGRGRS